jgi:hypothetical protein
VILATADLHAVLVKGVTADAMKSGSCTCVNAGMSDGSYGGQIINKAVIT